MLLIKDSEKRIKELDFLRGIALLLMVYFHLIWSMNEIYGYHIFYNSGINFYIGKLSAILFILISGIVYSFGTFKWKRFLLLASIAILITIVSYLYGSEYGINFGIIHFFAISSLLAILFSKINKYIIIVIGVGIIAAGFWIQEIHVNSDYLFFLGFVSNIFHSADYYPLIPRFGLYLIGMGISKIVYANKTNIFGTIFNIRPITFIGRNTLLIYLIHQPIIIGILYILQLLK